MSERATKQSFQDERAGLESERIHNDSRWASGEITEQQYRDELAKIQDMDSYYDMYERSKAETTNAALRHPFRRVSKKIERALTRSARI